MTTPNASLKELIGLYLTVIVSDPVSEDRHLNGALDTNSQNAIGIEHQG